MARANFPSELKNQVREYYVRNATEEPEISWLSKSSETIFGMHIPEETLKDWKRYDPKGDWSHQRAILNPASISDEVEAVRQAMYRLVVSTEPIPAAARASAARAYVELVAKSTPKAKVRTPRSQIVKMLKETRGK